MKTIVPPRSSRLQQRLWRGLAWLVGYERTGAGRCLDSPGDPFWREDFPRGAELLEAWLILSREHLAVLRTLSFAVLTGQDASAHNLRPDGWSRVMALALLLVASIPGRWRPVLPVASIAVAIEAGGTPYQPGSHQWLEIDLLKLRWALVRDPDHHV